MMDLHKRLDLPASFHEGELEEARREIDDQLRHTPTADTFEQAIVVCSLLHEVDAADRAVDALARHDPSLASLAIELRACVFLQASRHARAGTAVGAILYRAVPGAESMARAYGEAREQLARRDYTRVAATLRDASAAAAPSAGTLRLADGTRYAFANLIDLDGVTGPWLPYASASSFGYAPYIGLRDVEFLRPTRLCDAVWHPVRLVWRDGTTHDARVPTMYDGSGLHSRKDVRHGAATHVTDNEDFVSAFGRRMFVTQRDRESPRMFSIQKVHGIEFDLPTPPASPAKPFWQRLLR